MRMHMERLEKRVKALEEENVSVERVSLSDGGEGRILVNVWLRRNGETMEVTVGV